MSKKQPGEDVLTTFVIENKERLYRLAYSYVKNPDDALDIVQESITKAIASRKSLKKDEALRSWFYRILINTSRDYLRKKNRFQLIGEEAMQLHDAAGKDEYPDFDLQKALDAMPEKYRSVIILRYFEDLKIEEVAQVLDENVNTIKTRLYRALAMLRIQMDDVALEEGKEHGSKVGAAKARLYGNSHSR